MLSPSRSTTPPLLALVIVPFIASAARYELVDCGGTMLTVGNDPCMGTNGGGQYGCIPLALLPPFWMTEDMSCKYKAPKRLVETGECLPRQDLRCNYTGSASRVCMLLDQFNCSPHTAYTVILPEPRIKRPAP